ncbi:hypothetical protein DPEC_G00266970 [Dallia pectoralis]|uniref:Uncharacterized protein n=1 Tax=Dallia pectoralis TaxID=75939 RepID=A0ACC2FNG6_DALPE|nr:hypothetical protein DPEC_G00266970 [Dallia pectoralis]
MSSQSAWQGSRGIKPASAAWLLFSLLLEAHYSASTTAHNSNITPLTLSLSIETRSLFREHQTMVQFAFQWHGGNGSDPRIIRRPPVHGWNRIEGFLSSLASIRERRQNGGTEEMRNG